MTYAGRNKQELKFYGSYLVGTGVLPHQWEFKTLNDGSVMFCSSKWEAIRVTLYEHNPNAIHQAVDLTFAVNGSIETNGYSLKTNFTIIGNDNLFINAKVNDVRIDGIIRVWLKDGRPEMVGCTYYEDYSHVIIIRYAYKNFKVEVYKKMKWMTDSENTEVQHEVVGQEEDSAAEKIFRYRIEQLANSKVKSAFDIPKDERPSCPNCHKNDKVVPIGYGLPMINYFSDDGQEVPQPEPKPYVRPEDRDSYNGGCMYSSNSPKWYCKRDEEKFT